MSIHHALEAVHQALCSVIAAHDPGKNADGDRSLLIIQRVVEERLANSYPVSAVLEISIRFDREIQSNADEFWFEIDQALAAGTLLSVGGGAPEKKVILFAHTFYGSRHYITSDPSCDMIKSAYVRKILRDLEQKWRQNADVRGVVNLDFSLARPIEYVGIHM
jgi:hypothetical protein